jgi:superfamily I DNA and/or RNA helicase
VEGPVEVDDNNSSRNLAEARATKWHLQAINERLGAKMPTTVLTFYLAHRRLLRSFIGTMDVELATIDTFQGRERERVVLNLVEGNMTVR